MLRPYSVFRATKSKYNNRTINWLNAKVKEREEKRAINLQPVIHIWYAQFIFYKKKSSKKKTWLKYCTVPNKHVDGSQEWQEWQVWSWTPVLNQTREFYFQQHLFTSLSLSTRNQPCFRTLFFSHNKLALQISRSRNKSCRTKPCGESTTLPGMENWRTAT